MGGITMFGKPIVIGMAGAGRGTELHMAGYAHIKGLELRLKTIIGRRMAQVGPARERYGFERASTDFEDLIRDPEIDVIDICTPPYCHYDMIVRALNAGKHVICEKPLTGYFGMPGDPEPIGDRVPRSVMYEHVLRETAQLKQVIDHSGRLFMYAENFIYAPAIQKAAEIITARKSRILFMKGEESLKGSSSPVAGEWNRTGGGTFIRTGTHPLSAVLWLKHREAEAHHTHIGVESVTADMARLTTRLTEHEHRHIAARPHDVEDCGSLLLTFTDGTKANIIATDTLLGGSRNYVDVYCNDAAMNCNLTMTDAMKTYMLDESGMEDVYLSEMLPSKTGWNYPFIADEVLRGYTAEMQDFMECVAFGRQPESDFSLACETIQTIYAGYLSAEQGQRVQLLAAPPDAAFGAVRTPKHHT